MDYEKKYKNALERAKKFIEANPLVQNLNTWIKETFPELAESESERIRKALIHEFEGWNKRFPADTFAGFTPKEILAWLEKQGEKEPTIEMKSAEESLGIDSDTYNEIVDECIYGEQKSAWSEEDEERLSDAIFFVREYQIPTRDKRLLNAAKETEDWLKSLKQRMGR
jgi:hypothetical protein